MPSQQVIKKQIRTLEQESTKKVSNSQNKQYIRQDGTNKMALVILLLL